MSEREEKGGGRAKGKRWEKEKGMVKGRGSMVGGEWVREKEGWGSTLGVITRQKGWYLEHRGMYFL